VLREHVRTLIKARAEWLEDILAGLLINGIKPEEISVRDTFGPKTEVWVRGKLRYTWNVVYKEKNEPKERHGSSNLRNRGNRLFLFSSSNEP